MLALHNLLLQIVDYAGLFPPAALPLSEVIKNYETYVTGNHNFKLGRLIVPASKLTEFAETHSGLFPDGYQRKQPVWGISALIPPVDAEDDAFAKAMQAIQSFNCQNTLANVDTVEGKLPSSELISETCEKLDDSLAAFLEIPHDDPDETISRLASWDRASTFGKIRTGGVTPNLIPSTERVANFIHQCARANLGFKATAGLHHPLRGEFALTYEPDAERGMMHGFINVFLAACFAKVRSWPVTQLIGLLAQSDPEAFTIHEDRIEFDGDEVSASEIESVRRDFAISFGSCSFTEPVGDLIGLGWLANAAKTV